MVAPTVVLRPGPVESVLSGVLRVLGLMPGEGGSVDNPVLLGLLAWSRRVDGLLFAQSPTAAPAQTNQGSVVVTGTLGASDPNGAQLEYRVTEQPTNGTVVIGADGTYTFTSSEELATAGGSDSFTVEVRQIGFRLHLTGGSSTITVPVAVTVAENAAPTQLGPCDISTVLPDGMVIGQIPVADPNGDSLTYSVSTGPTRGDVSVYAGYFQYTPTPVAQLQAASVSATADGKQDSFTITVSDGIASTEVEVTVPISPPGNVVIGAIDVGGNPQGVAVAPNGAYLYAGNIDGTISVIDNRTGRVIDTLGVAEQGIPGAVSIAISPDGGRLFATNPGSNTVSVYDLTDLTPSITNIEVGSYPSAIVLSPDGTAAWVVNTNDGTVSVIDTAAAAVIDSISVGNLPTAIAWSSADGRAYVADGAGGAVWVIDTLTHSVTDTLTVGGSPSAIAVDSDGTHLYISDLDSRQVSVINTATGEVAATIDVGVNPEAMAISPDDRLLYVANSADNNISVIDTRLNAVITTIEVGSTPTALNFDITGTHAYVSNTNSGTISIISLAIPPTELNGTKTKYAYFHNLSDKALKITKWSYVNVKVSDNPPVGWVIWPGATVPMVVDYTSSESYLTMELSPIEVDPWTSEFFAISVRVLKDQVNVSCASNYGRSTCGAPDGWYHATDTAVVLPSTAKTYVLSGTEAQKQADVLKAMCDRNGVGQCTFTPTSWKETYGFPQATGIIVVNSTDSMVTYSKEQSFTQTDTNSTDITISAESPLLKIVTAAFSVTVHKEFSRSQTYTESVTTEVPPHSGRQIIVETPVYRMYGNFLVTWNGVTWSLNDVYFDSPNPSRQVRWTVVPYDGTLEANAAVSPSGAL